jgi:hypothetical protein
MLHSMAVLAACMQAERSVGLRAPVNPSGTQHVEQRVVVKNTVPQLAAGCVLLVWPVLQLPVWPCVKLDGPGMVHSNLRCLEHVPQT